MFSRKTLLMSSLLCSFYHLSYCVITLNNDVNNEKNIRLVCTGQQILANPPITIKAKQQNIKLTANCYPVQLQYQILPVKPGDGWKIFKKKTDTGEFTNIADGDTITFSDTDAK